ncbi:MAG: maltose alpha-D-glucosyltransferase [Anaerolineae bacterium]|nr:maltose alpha-D-glucosyltransferase [Anaerolineae bacterium]
MVHSKNIPWHMDAVFYELNVRAFYDSNDDGIGDLHGIAEKLDHIQQLGIDCIWLLPINPSPLEDDGYDVADYIAIHPDYGSLEDFDYLIQEAHARGLHVIVDLVINHTSDQHPWFVESRASRDNPKRDWYVWSDTDQRYGDTRIIFVDTQTSNWTYDEQTEQYYWHRFYPCQPDLNFDNPEVHQAMFDIMRFWLDRGIDGFRVDAIPYLYEREGTSCENLPETHEFVRQMRRIMDEEYPEAIMLCEANQPPQDVLEYFGDGDECHMAFHFPLMPRIFMALRSGDSTKIRTIMSETPHIPDNCQWCIFLRNHDELTLEMVTEEERQWMWEQYAPLDEMRLNLGIRRRLAPLLDNNIEKILLANRLLFSLPGAPIIYYGDEIGMGDNIDLPDRNGVRTPMQWNDGPNAGFSNAALEDLYAPPIDDPVYGYQQVNVVNQQDDSGSLLNQMHSLIALRKEHPVLALGTLAFIETGSPSVLGFVREYGDQTVLVFHNLARRLQRVEAYLDEYAGQQPQNLLNDAQTFHPIGAAPYRLSMAPYQSLWLLLNGERN